MGRIQTRVSRVPTLSHWQRTPSLESGFCLEESHASETVEFCCGGADIIQRNSSNYLEGLRLDIPCQDFRIRSRGSKLVCILQFWILRRRRASASRRAHGAHLPAARAGEEEARRRRQQVGRRSTRQRNRTRSRRISDPCSGHALDDALGGTVTSRTSR